MPLKTFNSQPCAMGAHIFAYHWHTGISLLSGNTGYRGPHAGMLKLSPYIDERHGRDIAMRLRLSNPYSEA
ncbi:hypothetical protein [Komagataeibacter sp. NFXK3]